MWHRLEVHRNMARAYALTKMLKPLGFGQHTQEHVQLDVSAPMPVVKILTTYDVVNKLASTGVQKFTDGGSYRVRMAVSPKLADKLFGRPNARNVPTTLVTLRFGQIDSLDKFLSSKKV